MIVRFKVNMMFRFGGAITVPVEEYYAAKVDHP